MEQRRSALHRAVTYLNHEHTVASWLLTKDHKRIGIMYLVVVTARVLPRRHVRHRCIRLELATPAGDLVSADTYNKLFTMHGVAMVFFVLIPAVPAILGQLRAAADARRQGRRVPEDQPPELVHLRHRLPVHRLRDGVRRRRHRLDLLHAVQQPRLEHQRDDDRHSASSSPASRRS